MKNPPRELDGATVIQYVVIPGALLSHGNVLHTVNGVQVEGVRAIAISKYEDSEDHYLFYCDSEWNVLTDLCRETLDAAIGQAQWEYEGISQHWTRIAEQQRACDE